jgi:hypothetical protein
MQAFPCETFRQIMQFLDHHSLAAMRLTSLSNFLHGRYPPSECNLLSFADFEELCADVVMFRQAGRLNESIGYAGFESLSLPINCTRDNLDWVQFQYAMEWINPKILLVNGFIFNAPSCWDRLSSLLTQGCQVLQLDPTVPEITQVIQYRRYRVSIPDSGGPTDTVSPYTLSTITTEQLRVLQKAPNIHHLSLEFLEPPVLGHQPEDGEMSFIDHLSMSNLTSLYLAKNVGHDLPPGEFMSWACYWAKEEDGWTRIAHGENASLINMLTVEQLESQCEYMYHTTAWSHSWTK